MYIVVLVTAKNMKEANVIADILVGKKLIACANIIKDIQSVFRWQGKVEKADEVLLILKTQQESFSKIVKAVKEHHSYEVPEIIALPVLDGNKKYLNWIQESCAD